MNLTRLVVGIVLSLAVSVHAGWRADCRHMMRLCRQTHALSLVPTTTTTTTTLPQITVRPFTGLISQNCGQQPLDCITVSGLAGLSDIYCPPWSVISSCSLPQFCP